jgi:6-pyruvoyltetrahydropterin/6-carboxytetrahydropterin synthase
MMTRPAIIEIQDENLTFSAGHFVIFSDKVRENLHGHTYTVQACFTTLVGEEGLAFDLRFYQEKIYRLCCKLNLIVLIPGLSRHLTITEENGYYGVFFNGEKLMFLKRDMKILPVTNITLEELSNWMLGQLLIDQTSMQEHRIREIKIKVSSGPGRAASSEWRLET